MKLKNEKKENGVCGGIRHTNTNSPTHTPWIDCKNLKKKEKRKERSTKDVASFVFPFQFGNENKIENKIVCVCVKHSHKNLFKKKYEKEIRFVKHRVCMQKQLCNTSLEILA